MTEYLELTGQGGVAAITIFVLVALIVVGIIFLKRKRKRIMDKQKGLSQTAILQSSEKKEEEVKKQSILGMGQYKCMVYRPGNVIDFTTMPDPIGEMYQADTSCPVSGGIYIVRQLENGEVIDYDPREVPVIIGETPEYAWFATHWDIVKQVFSVPLKWWQSTSTWFAAGALIAMFILGLVTLGG